MKPVVEKILWDSSNILHMKIIEHSKSYLLFYFLFCHTVANTLEGNFLGTEADKDDDIVL